MFGYHLSLSSTRVRTSLIPFLDPCSDITYPFPRPVFGHHLSLSSTRLVFGHHLSLSSTRPVFGHHLSLSSTRLGEVASLACNFCLSVEARTTVQADSSFKCTNMLTGRHTTGKQTTNSVGPMASVRTTLLFLLACRLGQNSAIFVLRNAGAACSCPLSSVLPEVRADCPLSCMMLELHADCPS